MRGSIGVGAPVSTRKFKLITSKTKTGNGPFQTANKIILLPRPPPFKRKILDLQDTTDLVMIQNHFKKIFHVASYKETLYNKEYLA